MKKTLALILAVLMLVPLFAACTKDGGNTGDGGNTTDDVDKTSGTTAYVREKFADINYNGDAFRILAISPGEHYQSFASEDSTEIWYEEDNADALQHAVFTRNLLTEDLLNVKISPLWGGTYRDVTELTKTLVKSGSDDADLIHNAHSENIALAMENHFYNLYDIDSFDVTEEWWDQNYVETFTMAKRNLAVITGDLLTMDDYSTPVLFYNKNVIDLYNLEDPADLVEDGTWTIDAMMEMAAYATSDTSGNGKMDENDSWGLLDNGYALSHFLSGCNAPLTKLDDEGMPMVAIEQESFLNAVQTVFEKVTMSTSYLNTDNGTDVDIMKDDRGLFYYELLGGIYNFRDMEGDFSLLPLPKMDLNQQKYTSIANGIWCLTVAIPITVRNPEKAATILSVLGGMSTDTVDKALNEIVLGPKLFREKRTRDMFEYCVNSRTFDWANGIQWANPIYSAISDQETNATFTFASALQKNIKVIKAQLKRFVSMYHIGK